jgi:hypothetical protein
VVLLGDVSSSCHDGFLTEVLLSSLPVPEAIAFSGIMLLLEGVAE